MVLIYNYRLQVNFAPPPPPLLPLPLAILYVCAASGFAKRAVASANPPYHLYPPQFYVESAPKSEFSGGD